MRKKLFLIMLTFSFLGSLKSQLLQFEIANNYLHANEWNKAIQTYNFSRPFLSEPQPLFKLGLNFSATYLLTNKKKLNHGIGLGYSYFNSYALNDSFSNSLLLNFLSINYILQWKAKQTEGGLYSEMNLSLKSSGLFRRVNDEAFLVDESVSKAYGLGGDLGLKVGYMLPSKRRSGLAFFLGAGTSPFFWSTNTEGVINQTSELASKSWTSILHFSGGISIRFRKV